MFQKMKWFVAMLLVLGICTDSVLAELIGYWPFDEGQGTEAADITGNGNDGTFNGAVEWVAGYKGSGVYFDTAGERVAVGPLDPTAGTDAMTLAIWINWQGEGHTIEHQGIIGKRLGWDPDNGHPTTKWFWETTPTGDLVFRNGVDGVGWGNTLIAAYPNEWIHVAVTWNSDGTTVQYINGEEVETGNITFKDTADDTPVVIGCTDSTNTETFVGIMDEARIFNHALTQPEIQTIMLGEFPTAFSPDPADGAIHEDTWASLSWKPGTSAVSHDVYFGDNFDDVNAGAESVFQGNQGDTFIVVGFSGFAYPDGLVPGTTYYWRIDEINDTELNSPWVGDVWSFMVPPKSAYDPNPADGAKFIDPNVELGWSPGFETKLHNVYFGDNFADVDAGTGDTAKGPLGSLSFSPGTLESDKTYYWRIDEFDGVETHKGNIWSFAIAGTGGGVRADYYTGMNFENLVLTRTDPQIDFNWGDPGGPDPAVGDDNFSARWTGEVEAAFTETYTFYTNSDDGIRLWVDGQLLVENWTNHSNTENKGTIDLVAGNTYGFVMEYYEDGSGAVAQLRWSSSRTPKDLIPQAALSLPVKASSSNPSNRAVDVIQITILSWGAGQAATSHEVYFGTDEEAVRNADTSSSEYKGSRNLGSESYDPGKLEWDITYYWRVDEVEADGTLQKGNVWSFTTANFIVVDDFESYNDLDPDDPQSNRIFNAWLDGFDNPAINGGIVGYANPPFAEQTIVHGGSQSMPFSYDNGVGKSEATMTLTYPRNWTENSIDTLTIWFRGNPGGLIEGPAGTFTMSGAGVDIWDQADEFRYAYKQLSGAGTITAQVLSVENTDGWAKAGVMIRESLDPGSKFAFVCVTPGNGLRFQARLNTGADATSDTSVETSEQTAITAPYWVKLDRDAAGNFNGYYSSDGVNWQAMTWNSQNITMPPNVYIGLALTSHSSGVACVAEFSDVETTGSVSPLVWNHEAIGATMTANVPETMYVALNGNAVVNHDNPNAASIDDWTQWNIDLQAFADQGVNLANVTSITLGLGNRSNPVAGGSGMMYFDDIRLYRPAPASAVSGN